MFNFTKYLVKLLKLLLVYNISGMAAVNDLFQQFLLVIKLFIVWNGSENTDLRPSPVAPVSGCGCGRCASKDHYSGVQQSANRMHKGGDGCSRPANRRILSPRRKQRGDGWMTRGGGRRVGRRWWWRRSARAETLSTVG
jgi:hypothetical protein